MRNAKTIQLVSAVVILLAGIALLFIGVFAPPRGTIDNSILVAFGEGLTFVGSIFGIDYNYRYKMTKMNYERSSEKS